MIKDDLVQRFWLTRRQTEALCSPLLTEDFVIQGMPEVSPPKWHLAHTTWFFEKALLQTYCPYYQLFNTDFHHLFNSYYQTLGSPFPRAQRGILSRPSVQDIFHYRHYVEQQLQSWLCDTPLDISTINALMELGIHHEQQHQELLLMDIKYNFSLNPMKPVYLDLEVGQQKIPALQFITLPHHTAMIGADPQHFHFDNESPQHEVIILSFAIANRLITNEEYMHFVEDNGYHQSQYWLADGWDWIKENRIEHPLYWQKDDKRWNEFTLHGLKKLNLAAPVAHVSFYEADAFARWKKSRLPTEMEWEYAVNTLQTQAEGNFLEAGLLVPQLPQKHASQNPYQFFGDLWEWTASDYAPYPRYRPFESFLSEYNGKFMINQKVLRGGSCITPQTHMRASYRNFFQPDKRWLFCGIRLVQEREDN